MMNRADNSENEQGKRMNAEFDALLRLEAELDSQPEGEDNDMADLYEPKEPSSREMRGMLCKPSDFNPRRERMRGIMI